MNRVESGGVVTVAVALVALTVVLLPVVATPACAQSRDSLAPAAGAEDPRRPVDVETAPRPEAPAVRATGPIRIDGRLDEETWERAREITGFIQSQPSPGYPATEKTVVRVLYDEDYLYIGALCYDSKPDELTVHSLRQDFETHDSDVFAVTIDPFLDRRNAFMFLVNPGGAVKDGQVFNNSRGYNLAWEGVIHLETTRHEQGWTVELAIPFTTLRFDPGEDTQAWGMNFLRRIRRKSEDAYWAPLDRRELVHKMSRAGTITGFQGLTPGRNMSVKPYGLAGMHESEAAGTDDLTGDAGLDAKWGLTPRLTLDATLNTDFSQVEVDQERVNLTRFSLFFPEKRDVFLENSGTFDFGDVTERNYRMGASQRDFTLFHSRRIGLDRGGTPIPIAGGGRLTGRVGNWEVGLLDMQTRGGGELPPENFAVLRVRRNLFGTSDVGAIFINREATEGSPSHNRSYGADANVKVFRNLILNSYYAWTDDSELSGDEWAGRLSLAWRDQLWDVSAFHKRVGDAFAPDVGFVRRKGVRHTYGTVGVHPRPGALNLQEVNPYAEVHYFTDLDGLLETRALVGGFAAEFLDGSSASIEVEHRFERLDEAFSIRPDASIPAGEYEFSDVRLSYVSNQGRPLSARVDLSRGSFWNGDKTSLGITALWRVDARLGFDLFAERNEVTLVSDAFSADVIGLRARYYYSTRLFTTAFFQYNAELEELVTNLRINLIHAPLSDVFLVLRERRHLGGEGVENRQISVKVTRLFAF